MDRPCNTNCRDVKEILSRFWSGAMKAASEDLGVSENMPFMWIFLTYLLTPWSRVLLEKLTSSQLVKKFSAFYENRRLITAFTSARHQSLF